MDIKDTAIKFNRYYVIDTKTKVRARVFYSLDNRGDARKCVTLHAKDYGRDLGKIFPNEYLNDTDSMSDYFDTGRVNLFEDHPLYMAARERATAIATAPTHSQKTAQAISGVEVIKEEATFHPETEATSRILELKCGKHKAVINISNGGRFSPFVNVLVTSNAAHNPRRGAGHFFHGYKQAIRHYRTPEIKGMIEYAIAKTQPQELDMQNVDSPVFEILENGHYGGCPDQLGCELKEEGFKLVVKWTTAGRKVWTRSGVNGGDIVTYCEGDLSIKSFTRQSEFEAHIAICESFYQEHN